jgi:viologen exporter family transport system permease protein
MATYRGATFAGVVTNTAFGFILSYVLLAVFRERGAVGGFDATDAVTFTFVAQGLLMPVGMFGSDREMAERILTGEVAMDLARPYDYQGWWAAVACGKAWFYAGARGVPPFLAASLVLHLRLPEEAWVWLAFPVSVGLAVGVAFAWGFLLQLSAFWIVDVRGPAQFGWMIAQFLGGMIVPVFLFPDGLEALVRALPFVAMLQLPAEVFLGKHSGVDLVGVYGHQLAWLVVLAGAGRLVLARSVRRVVVHGG